MLEMGACRKADISFELLNTFSKRDWHSASSGPAGLAGLANLARCLKDDTILEITGNVEEPVALIQMLLICT